MKITLDIPETTTSFGAFINVRKSEEDGSSTITTTNCLYGNIKDGDTFRVTKEGVACKIRDGKEMGTVE